MMPTLAITERCFELELETFELPGDLTEWKRRLRPHTRAYDMFRVYRQRSLPLARFAYRRHLSTPTFAAATGARKIHDSWRGARLDRA